MGKATILSGGTDGLYAIRPQYNNAPLDKMIADLIAARSAALPVLGRATNTLSLLEDETEVARAAMNAVIAQWQQSLLDGGDPPALAPETDTDPDTGMPWSDSDKAQEGPLFDAINAARTSAGKSALTRDSNLDLAAKRHIYDMASGSGVGHVGSDRSVPSSRVAATGYQADLVVELLACGEQSATSAVNAWTRAASAPIFSDIATQVGVAYTYASSHPATYLWVAVLAHPDPNPSPDPPSVTYPDDPAQKAAREQEAGLERIEAPRTETATPERLAAMVQKFGIAAAKEAEARRELARLLAEYDGGNRKLEALNALKSKHDGTSIAAWCADLSEEIAAGTLVDTFEPPGYRNGDAIHIAPYGSDPQSWDSAHIGQLRYAETLTEAQVFVNLALEAGHLKWKPLWRYGVITELQNSADTCNLTLESVTSRGPVSDLSLNEFNTLSSVPIAYMTCNGAAFEVGDRVLVLFEGQDRSRPKVIGFADNPKPCGGWVENFDAPVYTLPGNFAAAWEGLLIDGGDGWPVSNTVPHTGVTGVDFQEWCINTSGAQESEVLYRVFWAGGLQWKGQTIPNVRDVVCYVTGNHHKMIVMDRPTSPQTSPPTSTAYTGDGDLFLSRIITNGEYSDVIIFPDDCQDFLVNGEASKDFEIWDDWDTIEVSFTVKARPTIDNNGRYYAVWLQVFLWKSFSYLDYTGLGGTSHLGMYGMKDLPPFGTSLVFAPFMLGGARSQDQAPGDYYGSSVHDIYMTHIIRQDPENNIWSTNCIDPWNSGDLAPSGWRYYCVYDPAIDGHWVDPETGATYYGQVEEAINGKHTFRVKRELIDPGHPIKAIQLAGFGDMRLHSIKFFKSNI